MRSLSWNYFCGVTLNSSLWVRVRVQSNERAKKEKKAKTKHNVSELKSVKCGNTFWIHKVHESIVKTCVRWISRTLSHRIHTYYIACTSSTADCTIYGMGWHGVELQLTYGLLIGCDVNTSTENNGEGKSNIENRYNKRTLWHTNTHPRKDKR